MVTRYADNGGVRIAFEELGGAGGDPLLLVMGLGTSRFWWPDGLAGDLVRRGFHVAAYDQRDAGESAGFAETREARAGLLRRRAASPYTAEDQADDAVAVLDALGWPAAHLFGHSMGGLVAQRVAIRHPSRVHSLTSSGAVPSDARGISVLRYLHPAMLPKFARLKYPETPQGDLDLAVAVARLLAAPGQQLGEGDVRELVEREAAHGVSSFRDVAAQNRQIRTTWHGGKLASIRVPTLAIHGEGDPLVRVRAARDVANAIPDARLRIVPGAGHFLARTSWPTYADEIRAVSEQAQDEKADTGTGKERAAGAGG